MKTTITQTRSYYGMQRNEEVWSYKYPLHSHQTCSYCQEEF
jgi:hypothetical protein